MLPRHNTTHAEVYSIQHYVIVCQWLVTRWWFSPVSSTNKTDRHDITEILLKVVLNTKILIPYLYDNTVIYIDTVVLSTSGYLYDMIGYQLFIFCWRGLHHTCQNKRLYSWGITLISLNFLLFITEIYSFYVM